MAIGGLLHPILSTPSMGLVQRYRALGLHHRLRVLAQTVDNRVRRNHGSGREDFHLVLVGLRTGIVICEADAKGDSLHA